MSSFEPNTPSDDPQAESSETLNDMMCPWCKGQRAPQGWYSAQMGYARDTHTRSRTSVVLGIVAVVLTAAGCFFAWNAWQTAEDAYRLRQRLDHADPAVSTDGG